MSRLLIEIDHIFLFSKHTGHYSFSKNAIWVEIIDQLCYYTETYIYQRCNRQKIGTGRLAYSGKLEVSIIFDLHTIKRSHISKKKALRKIHVNLLEKSNIYDSHKFHKNYTKELRRLFTSYFITFFFIFYFKPT